jgi:hypothetical protein
MEKTPQPVVAAAFPKHAEENLLLDNFDGFLDVMMRLVDVLQSTLLEALGEGIVFFLGDVAVSFVDELECPVQAAAPIKVRVDRWIIVEVLSVIDRGFLDLFNGVVDFVNGFLFLFSQLPAVRALQVSPRLPEIGERVQIGRMLAWRRRLCRVVRGQKQQQCKNREQKLVGAFHRVIHSSLHEIGLQAICFAGPRTRSALSSCKAAGDVQPGFLRT